MADELQLNSIERFRKHSPRLHLEEHGSCEVPAGCGGIVLRWYNPGRGIPILLHAHLPVPAAEFLLNGETPPSARCMVPLGAAVLALRFAAVPGKPLLGVLPMAGPPRSALLMLAAQVRPNEGGRKDREPSYLFHSEPDGTWKFTLQAPRADWTLPTFDDCTWASLVEQPMPTPAEDDYRGKSDLADLTRHKARSLGLPAPHAGPVWVRKTFEAVPEPRP